MNRIEKFICFEESSIRDAMRVIDTNARGIAFVVDSNGRMVGTISDGDIRRALLAGYGLNDRVQDHMNRDFVFAYQDAPPEEIKDKFSDRITVIPIVTHDRKPVDYADYDRNQRIVVAQPQMDGNEYKYLMDAFLSTWISSKGEYITRFEQTFADYCGVKFGVATSNGTTALHLALTALGIGPGDEVIVPDLTFAATINSVIYTGATPVIVDIEEDSWCISPKAVEAAITPRTRAIIPVHLYGQPCDMEQICRIAGEHGLYVVEDCAEAHGAEWNGKKVGSFGDIACFSFFGNKVVTTGEGGMCVTDDETLRKKLLLYRDHGMDPEKRYWHKVIGYNYRMTNLQAAIGLAQVEHIEEILDWRKKLEDRYAESFREIPGVRMQARDLKGRKKIAWLVSITVDPQDRDGIMDALKKNSVESRPFFYTLSEMEIYRRYAADCPVSARISRSGLNLPTTYDMNNEKIDKIVAIIRSVVA